MIYLILKGNKIEAKKFQMYFTSGFWFSLFFYANLHGLCPKLQLLKDKYILKSKSSLLANLHIKKVEIYLLFFK